MRSSDLITPGALPRNVHFLGICGRLVGGLALALRELGVKVTGTDDRQFGPLADLLRHAGIDPQAAWDPRHLPRRVDAVVMGGQVSPDNPELLAARERNVPILNATAFLDEHFFRHSRNLVVCGTKGKSTTTAMLAWILRRERRKSGHLMGARIRGNRWPLLRLGFPTMVIEGDEYPCGPDDPRPKFHLHHPEVLVVTNVSHDHTDAFPSPRSYHKAFVEARGLLPPNGALVLNADDPGALALASRCPVPVRTVGFSSAAATRIRGFRPVGEGCCFRFNDVPFCLRIGGTMNAIDAALAASAAAEIGIPLDRSAAALALFPGVEGRMEVLARIGRTVVYADETYHPVALAPLVRTIRARHPKQRLITIYGPANTGGRRGLAQTQLPEILGASSAVFLLPAADPPAPPARAFSPARLCRELGQTGSEAREVKSLPEMIEWLRDLHRDGDIILIAMPIGPQVIHRRVVDALRAGAENPSR